MEILKTHRTKHRQWLSKKPMTSMAPERHNNHISQTSRPVCVTLRPWRPRFSSCAPAHHLGGCRRPSKQSYPCFRSRQHKRPDQSTSTPRKPSPNTHNTGRRGRGGAQDTRRKEKRSNTNKKVPPRSYQVRAFDNLVTQPERSLLKKETQKSDTSDAT